MRILAKPTGRALAVLIMMNFTGLAPAFAQGPAANGEPAIKNLLENATVKAYLVTFQPGEALPKMDRPKRILYYQSSGTLQREYPDGKVEDRPVKEGDTRCVEASSFGVKNVGGTAVVIYVVEVK